MLGHIGKVSPVDHIDAASVISSVSSSNLPHFQAVNATFETQSRSLNTSRLQMRDDVRIQQISSLEER